MAGQTVSTEHLIRVENESRGTLTVISPANSLEKLSSGAGPGRGEADMGDAELEDVGSACTSGFFEGSPQILDTISIILSGTEPV